LLELARHDAAARRPPADRRAEVPVETLPDDRIASPDLDLWTAFHEAVERLPAEEREVVGLVFYHGWTQSQVAELFQVSERTIARRWHSACLQLQTMLDGRLPSR
jgi:RNA polymerase sigma factor (sigma-70 family)